MGGVEQIKTHWDNRGLDESLEEKSVTHPDIWQRWLEIETIKSFLRPQYRVLDVGCGNGFTTLQLSPLCREVVGVDYSESLIRRAKENSQSLGLRNVNFLNADVLNLPFDKLTGFDLVLSERCLINLRSWEDQKRALSGISHLLKPEGKFLFVEGGRNGREQLNHLRTSMGLTPMPPVWHNLDFDEEQTRQYLETFFDFIEEKNFGVYDLIARVLHPLLVAPEKPTYEAKINEWAAQLCQQCQGLPQLSRVLFWVLKRR